MSRLMPQNSSKIPSLHLFRWVEKNFRMLIVVSAILLAAAAGLFGLIYSSNIAPLVIGAMIVLPMIGVIFLNKPELALFAAILIVSLPDGLISAQIQSYLNRGLVIAAVAVWAYSTLSKRRKLIFSAPTWLFLAFLVWSFLSLLWADRVDRGTTVFQMYLLRWLLFLLIAVNLIDTREKLNGLMNSLALAGGLLIVTGAVVLLVQGYVPGTRFQLLEMNENSIGTNALIYLIGILWWASQPGSRYSIFRKMTALLYLVMAVLLVVISGSRGSLLSLAGTVAAFWLWKPTRKWGVAILILGLIGLLAAPFLFATTLDRFDISGTGGDTVMGGREGLWQAAWLLIQDNFWKGVGIGNAQYSIIPYFSKPSVQSVILPNKVWSAESVSFHNPVLTVLADTGFIGLIFYLGSLLAALIIFALHFYKKHHSAFNLYFPLIASIYLGYLISWIKGGGVETGHSHFLMILLLLLPSIIQMNVVEDSPERI